MATSGQNQNGTRSKLRRQGQQTDSFLESLRDIGDGGARSLKQDLGREVPREFFRQLLGVEKPPRRGSGELKMGRFTEIEAALQEREENKILRRRLAQEHRLREEDQALFEKKGQELKVELKAVTEEVENLAKTTHGLSEKVEVAAMQAPVNPGVYHVVFFEKLREFIASFRKKIENASVWLQSYNQRSKKKKGFWGQVADSGARRLLSAEDVMGRQAG